MNPEELNPTQTPPNQESISDPQTPLAPTTPEEKITLAQIRTFQGDVAGALTNQGESIYSIREKERARSSASPAPEREEDEEGRKILFFVVGTLFLLALGGFSGWYGYKELKKKTSPPPETFLENRFFGTSQTTYIDLPSQRTRLDIINLLNKEGLADAIQDGQVLHIIIQERVGEIVNPTTSENFLRMLEAKAPGSFLRSLEPPFMYGVLGAEEKSRFLILKTSSFENAFAGMLSWERTLAEDIGPIFASSDRVRNLEFGATFKDVTTRNKDARILYDVEGGEVILYSFFDNNFLIITDNIETLRTLIARLTSEKLLR